MNELSESNSSEHNQVTRVKVFGHKKTVGITLPQILVEKARKQGLNISRISEQALISILDYLESQNNETRSEFLSQGSFQKESWWTGRDLNPRPQRCQRCDHTKLIYPPGYVKP
jgi:post-segregation antitoxin (ccd killing protein)